MRAPCHPSVRRDARNRTRTGRPAWLGLARLASACLCLLAVAAPARAQLPVYTPGEEQPATQAPAPAAPAQPVVIPVPVDGRADGQADGPVDYAAELGNYHTDDLDGVATLFGESRQDGMSFSAAPSHHTVRQGDTLWDICWFYFNNPWEWPKVWSYNPHITNPHWIYPGDLVRLYPKGLEPATLPPQPAPDAGSAAPADDGGEDGIAPMPAPRYSLRLRQTAFVDQENLAFAGTIVGAVEEKMMLSYGDEVYIEYRDKPPTVGERYTIYNDVRPVTHPKTGQNVGAYVTILGELEVKSVKQGKRARAMITDSLDVIERGALVGPLQRTYRTVEPQRNEVDVQGSIIALLGSDELIGQGQLIFIDQGQEQGIKAGNRLYVIRRGDAYDEVKTPSSDIGQDDRRFPARAIGEIIVVQAGERSSVAMVTLALQEFGTGDLVLMRKTRTE